MLKGLIKLKNSIRKVESHCTRVSVTGIDNSQDDPGCGVLRWERDTNLWNEKDTKLKRVGLGSIT